MPFTLIFTPHPVRAYRFVYPTLLAASQDYQEAYLYDIPTGQLQQTVSLRHSLHFHLHIEYVDFSARHVFVCAEAEGLLIFSRQSNTGPPLIRFRPGVPDSPEALVDRTYYLGEHHNDDASAEFLSLRECPLQRGWQWQDRSFSSSEPSLEMGSAGT